MLCGSSWASSSKFAQSTEKCNKFVWKFGISSLFLLANNLKCLYETQKMYKSKV